MDEWIEVNGARIEKTFLEGNVIEARSYTWEQARELPLGHVHCMICDIAIGIASPSKFWKSTYGNMCDYCFTRFMKDNGGK